MKAQLRSERISARITKQMHHKIVAVSKQKKWSVSNLVEIALEDFLRDDEAVD